MQHWHIPFLFFIHYAVLSDFFFFFCLYSLWDLIFLFLFLFFFWLYLYATWPNTHAAVVVNQQRKTRRLFYVIFVQIVHCGSIYLAVMFQNVNMTMSTSLLQIGNVQNVYFVTYLLRVRGPLISDKGENDDNTLPDEISERISFPGTYVSEFPNNKGIKFAHLNVRSMRNKAVELQQFLLNNP